MRLMSKKNDNNRQPHSSGDSKTPKRHPLTLENSPEETIKRMRSLPERVSKLKEAVRELREADTR
jgi:hypothetical protein